MSAHLCWCLLMSAHLCSSLLISAHLCSSLLPSTNSTYSDLYHLCSSLLVSAHLCSSLLISAHLCSSLLVSARLCSSLLISAIASANLHYCLSLQVSCVSKTIFVEGCRFCWLEKPLLFFTHRSAVLLKNMTLVTHHDIPILMWCSHESSFRRHIPPSLIQDCIKYQSKTKLLANLYKKYKATPPLTNTLNTQNNYKSYK